jgi:ABC-type amino acid transport substrate-binding protein
VAEADEVDIFLSYSSGRRSAVEHVARTLEAYGYTVWFDYKLIEGRDFAFQLDDHLRSARLTIVLWCPLSVNSRWVHEEADLAATLDRLLPVKMEKCELKLGTRRLQYEDLTDWDGAPRSKHINELLNAISTKIGKTPVIDHAKLATAEEMWIASGRLTFAQHSMESDHNRLRSGPSGPSSVSIQPPVAPHASASSTAVHSLIRPGKLTIGIFPYPPLSVGAEPDAMSGPWPMLANALAAELGLQAEYRFTSYADLLENAYASVDVVVSVFETPRRRRYFDFTRPINRVGLLGLCRDAVGSVAEDGLRSGQYRTLVQEGEVGWEFMVDEAPRAIANKRVVSVDAVDGVEVLTMLKAGRYDVALIDALSCMNFLADPELSNGLRLAFDAPLNMFDSSVAIRKTSGLDLSQVDKIVGDLRNRPEYLEAEQEALRGVERIVRRVGLR